MKKIKKRPVTLLELLISIVLTIVILTTLLFFYRQVGLIGIETDKVMADNFRMRYVESRLAKILPNTVADKGDDNKDFVFFSVNDEGLTKPGSQSLIFTFDNGVSLDKEFSNHVLARIYVDKDNNLMLAYWPSPKRWLNGVIPPIKKEVLLEGADSVRFEFYIPPEKKENKPPAAEDEKASQPNKPDKPPAPQKKEKASPEPKGDWRRDLWLKEYETLPAMIRVIVTMPKEVKPVTFAFPIARSKNHVTYD